MGTSAKEVSKAAATATGNCRRDYRARNRTTTTTSADWVRRKIHLANRSPVSRVVLESVGEADVNAQYALEAFAKSSLGHCSDHARFEVGKGGLPPLLPNMYSIWKSGGKPPFPTSNLAWTLCDRECLFAKGSKARSNNHTVQICVRTRSKFPPRIP